MNPQPFLQLDRVIHEKGRLAIMAMLAASPELSFTELRDALKGAGYLSRDARAKERKKPGLKRARKGPTYTKR